MIQTHRFRRHCGILAALLLVAGILRLGLGFIPLFDPLIGTPAPDCSDCGFVRDPVTLLEPEQARKAAWQTPGSEQRIVAHLQSLRVRSWLFAAEMMRAIPFFMLLASLAAALRMLSLSGFTPAMVRRLRLAAFASIVWVLAQPVAQSIRRTVFSPVTDRDSVTHLVLDGGQLFWPMLLSFAVWICARALEQAAALQKDLEEYV
jgi:hypothetical protein